MLLQRITHLLGPDYNGSLNPWASTLSLREFDNDGELRVRHTNVFSMNELIKQLIDTWITVWITEKAMRR